MESNRRPIFGLAATTNRNDRSCAAQKPGQPPGLNWQRRRTISKIRGTCGFGRRGKALWAWRPPTEMELRSARS